MATREHTVLDVNNNKNIYTQQKEKKMLPSCIQENDLTGNSGWTYTTNKNESEYEVGSFVFPPAELGHIPERFGEIPAV